MATTVGRSSPGATQLGSTGPSPGDDTDNGSEAEQPGKRNDPGQQTKTACAGCCEDSLAEVRNELLLDLALRVPGANACTDEHADPFRDWSIGKLEGCLAGRTHHLA